MMRFLILGGVLWGVFVFASGTVWAQAVLAQDAPQYSSTEAYMRSGYDFLWSVVQDEVDSETFQDDAERELYWSLVDQMVRAGAKYGSEVIEVKKEMRGLYLRLLELDDTPPLYVQYRYLSSQEGSLWSSEDYLRYGDLLLEVAYQMDDTGYPLYVAGATWLKAAQLLEKAGYESDRGSIVAATKHGIDLLVEAAAMEGIDPKYHEHLSVRIAYHGYQYTTLQRKDQVKLCKLLLADEKADPWIGLFSSGALRIKLAWDARSSEYAKDVSDEQWAGMRKHLLKAHRHLTRAWKLRPGWPYPATSLITATMGHQVQSRRDVDFWFSEAIEARVDHYAAYSNFMYALTPKWGGDSEEMYRVIRFVIGLSEEELNMGRVLLKSVSTFSGLYESPIDILTDESVLPRLTELMLDEVEGESQYHGLLWQRKSLRSVALGNFEAQKYRECSQLLKVGGAMIGSGWSTWNEPYEFYYFAPLLGSIASDDVIRGLEALDADDASEARSHFVTARELLQKDQSQIDPELTPGPLQMIERAIELTE